MYLKAQTHPFLRVVDNNGRKIKGMQWFDTTTGKARVIVREKKFWDDGKWYYETVYLTKRFPKLTFIDKRTGSVFLTYTSAAPVSDTIE